MQNKREREREREFPSVCAIPSDPTRLEVGLSTTFHRRVKMGGVEGSGQKSRVAVGLAKHTVVY